MDDFFDDKPSSGIKSTGNSGSGPGGLLPIVEVPSDVASTATESARSDRDTASAQSTARTEHSDQSEDADTHRSEDHDE